MSELKKFTTVVTNLILSLQLPIILIAITIIIVAWSLLTAKHAPNSNQNSIAIDSVEINSDNQPDKIDNKIDNKIGNEIVLKLSESDSANLGVRTDRVSARRRSTGLPVVSIFVKLARYMSQRNTGGEDDAGVKPTAEIKQSLEEKQCLEESIKNGWRNTGWYMSPVKLSLYIFLFFFWAFSASWMNCDMERQENQKRELCNTGYVLLYVIIGMGIFFIPIFWVAFPMIALICTVPVFMYITNRNAKLPPHERVLTYDHLYFCLAQFLRPLGIKLKIKKRMVYEEGPQIEFEATGKGIDQKVLTGRLILARNSPGYNVFRQQVYDAISSEAASLMFDFAPDKTLIKHQVDGVWLDLPPAPRNPDKSKGKDAFDLMLESAKMLVGASPENRRAKQEGTFVALVGPTYSKKKTRYDVKFLSQGTPTGEAVLLQFTAAKVPFKSIASLGIRQEIEQRILGHLNAKQGIFVVAAPPANGLRSSMEVFARSCDRFTRDVVNVEEVSNRSEEIENISMVRYDLSLGESPVEVISNALFKEPHSVYVRDMLQLPVLELCCKDVAKGRLFVTMVRAKDSVEAILKFLETRITSQNFLQPLNAVICQRLIRKLCPNCKEPYKPSPQLLQQLGLNPNQAQQLYRKRVPLPEVEERKRGVCPTCNGIGYRGRTVLLEFIEMNDTIRGMFVSNQNPNEIRQYLQQQSDQTTFMREGIYLVLKGETTVEELSRVMKL
ncbi:MAG: hypothetical protein LBQ66_08235 [Planctomycetaceae bacterium]|jgi:type II secretory ATPase GspE/PulE/Tfp pilus assembly ATPase PilB-like protein|nr:hypothetical protein [Planctomycetaceae bacterium]